MKFHLNYRAILICTAAFPMISTPLYAQSSAENRNVSEDASRVGEIIVTAQRRSESLQKVPASISAVGAEEIASARIENVADIQRIAPGVNISNAFGTVQINIRGLGLESVNPNGEPSVLTYIDNVYIARPTAVAAAFEDLERIEVLRGPQGTLYGRNATGGVVNLITRKPGDTFKANLSGTYGSHNRIKLVGGVEGPVADDIAVRVAGYHESRDGDQINLFNGKKVRDLKATGIRGTLVSKLGDNVTATVRGDYYRDRINGVNFDLLTGTGSTGANGFGANPFDPNGILDNVDAGPASPARPNDGKHVAFNSMNPNMKHENWGGSLTLEWELNDETELKSITAYRRATFERNRMDFDGSIANYNTELFGHERSKTISQEVNLSGKTDSGASWVVGAYYFTEKLNLDYMYELPALALLIDAAFSLPAGTTDETLTFKNNAKTTSLSAFAQVTAPISDKLNLTAGLRKNYDKKSQRVDNVLFGAAQCGGVAPSKGKWNDLTWKVGVDYEITQNNMIYAQVSKGFKAGGLNLTLCDSQFDPEDVISYEAGVKNSFLGGSLLVNASAFYYDYTNLQVNISTATSDATENSSSARVYGLELEARAKPVENLEIGGNFSLLHAEYRGYRSINPLNTGIPGAIPEDLTGNRIAHAPKFIANGSIVYSIPVDQNEISVRYDVRHNSGYFGDPFRNFYQKAYTVHNARLSYRLANYEVGGFVDNFTNEIYALNGFGQGGAAGVISFWAPRRTWGVFANASF